MTAPREPLKEKSEETGVNNIGIIKTAVNSTAPFGRLLNFLKAQENTAEKNTPKQPPKKNVLGQIMPPTKNKKSSELFQSALEEKIHQAIEHITIQPNEMLELPEDGAAFFIASKPGELTPTTGDEHKPINTSWKVQVSPGTCIGIPGNLAGNRAFSLKNNAENAIEGYLVRIKVQDLIEKAGKNATLTADQIAQLQTIARENILEQGVKYLENINEIRKSIQEAASQAIHPDAEAIKSWVAQHKNNQFEGGPLKKPMYIDGKALISKSNGKEIATVTNNFIGYSGLTHIQDGNNTFKVPPDGVDVSLTEGRAYTIDMKPLSNADIKKVQEWAITGLWATLRTQYQEIADKQIAVNSKNTRSEQKVQLQEAQNAMTKIWKWFENMI